MVTSPSNIHRITQEIERSTRSVLKGVYPFSIGQAQVVRIRNDEITIMRSIVEILSIFYFFIIGTFERKITCEK